MLVTVDWAIIGVFIISTLAGVQRGLLREALSLLTWIAASTIAILFSGRLAGLVTDRIDWSSTETASFWLQFLVESPLVQQGIAFFVLFIVTLIIGGLVNNMLGGVVRKTSLSGLDRLLGSLFGFVRGLVLCLVLVASIYFWLPVEEYVWWQDSVLIPAFVTLLEQLPPSLLEQGRELFQVSGPDPIPG